MEEGDDGGNIREILFSQPEISAKFTPPCGLSIFETVYACKTGLLDPMQDFPALRVQQKGGQKYSIDNRRLWVAKQVGRFKTVEEGRTQELEYKIGGGGNGKTVKIRDADCLECLRFSQAPGGIACVWPDFEKHIRDDHLELPYLPSPLPPLVCSTHGPATLKWTTCSNKSKCKISRIEKSCSNKYPCHQSSASLSCGCKRGFMPKNKLPCSLKLRELVGYSFFRRNPPPAKF